MCRFDCGVASAVVGWRRGSWERADRILVRPKPGTMPRPVQRVHLMARRTLPRGLRDALFLSSHFSRSLCLPILTKVATLSNSNTRDRRDSDEPRRRKMVTKLLEKVQQKVESMASQDSPRAHGHRPPANHGSDFGYGQQHQVPHYGQPPPPQGYPPQVRLVSVAVLSAPATTVIAKNNS